MEKLLCISLFFILFPSGCELLGQQDQLIKIELQHVSYDSELKVHFNNILEKKVAVLTLGCSNSSNEYIPSFVSEKLEGDSWSVVGSPTCIAIASPPIILDSGDSKSIVVPVDIGINPDKIPGTFRYRFDIRTVDENGNPSNENIEEESRISQPFRISSD